AAGSRSAVATSFWTMTCSLGHLGEEDGAGRDDLLAGLETSQDGDEIGSLILIDGDETALELDPTIEPLTGGDEDHGLISEAKDRGARDRGCAMGRRGDPNVRVHLGLERVIVVVEAAADLRRPRGGIERVRDPLDRAFELAIRISSDLHHHLR